MPGDLFSIRENLERIIMFIGIIASHLSSSGAEKQEELITVAEICESLKLRIHYGVKEELLDLVQRIDNVARVRARILFDAGFHTATQVSKERPYVLSRKSGLGINLCKDIFKNLKEQKRKRKENQE